MTTGKKAALNIVLVCYVLGMAWLAYELIADPDPGNRRLQRLNLRYRTYQGIAEHFGRLGMDAEKSYHTAVEKMRTI